MAPIIRFKITVANDIEPKSWTTRDHSTYESAVSVLDALGIEYVVTTEVTVSKRGSGADFTLG